MDQNLDESHDMILLIYHWSSNQQPELFHRPLATNLIIFTPVSLYVK